VTGRIETPLPGDMPAQQLEVLIKASNTPRKKIRIEQHGLPKYSTSDIFYVVLMHFHCQNQSIIFKKEIGCIVLLNFLSTKI